MKENNLKNDNISEEYSSIVYQNLKLWPNGAHEQQYRSEERIVVFHYNSKKTTSVFVFFLQIVVRRRILLVPSVANLRMLLTPIDNEWLSCKILQDSGKILQDDTSSCKIFFQNLARSCKITLCLARILQYNHSSCKYANKWNMTEHDQNETRTLLPINFFYIVIHDCNQNSINFVFFRSKYKLKKFRKRK